MSRVARKLFWVSDQVQHKPGCTASQPQKMPGGLKFKIYEVERLYYQGSENKGTDQLAQLLGS